MKKLFLLLATAGMIMTACDTGNNNGDDTKGSSQIASIEEQSANINVTISTLANTKSAIEKVISNASPKEVSRADNNGVKTMIAALEERIEALEALIASLQNYTDEELTQIEDWTEATYATMDQYNALAAELATLKALVASIEEVSTQAIETALAESEKSMMSWVNEKLTGYYSIAEIDAEIAALKESLQTNNQEVQESIATALEQLSTLKSEVEASYKQAIADAISQNNGQIDQKIANAIATVNNRIDNELKSINSRLDKIEERLDEIEEALANLIKRIQSLVYIDSNGDEPTPVVTSAEAATVQLNFRVSPSEAAGELAANWREFVKVKAYYTDDMNTIVDLPITSYIGNGETGIISIEASGENLSDRFYTDLQQASLFLKISDGTNNQESPDIAIKAQRWMRKGIDLVPNNNEIYYTTTDANTKTPYKAQNINADIVSNLYNREKGIFVLTFGGEVTNIGSNAFAESTSGVSKTLKTMMLPNSVTNLGVGAFFGSRLEHIRLSDKLESIDKQAFSNNHYLIDITIPESVTKIGANAFLYAKKLEKFYGKFASKDNYCLIVDGVLRQTVARLPELYTIPEEVKLFGDGCIYTSQNGIVLYIPDTVEGVEKGAQTVTECSWRIQALKGKFTDDNSISMIIDGVLYGVAGYQMKSYKVPEGVEVLPELLFQGFSLTEVWLPKTISKIANKVFTQCNKLDYVYCQAVTPPKTGTNIFGSITNIPIIYVPRESLADYQQSEYWKNFADKIVAFDF